MCRATLVAPLVAQWWKPGLCVLDRHYAGDQAHEAEYNLQQGKLCFCTRLTRDRRCWRRRGCGRQGGDGGGGGDCDHARGGVVQHGCGGMVRLRKRLPGEAVVAVEGGGGGGRGLDTRVPL